MAEGVSTGEETLDRFDRMRDERDSWDSEWQDIMTYVFPRRSIWRDNMGRAERVGENVYDGTAIGALNLLANGLMGYFVSSAYPWFKLRLPHVEANELPEVGEWLDTCERVLYDDMHRSNFYEETVEIFRDAGAIGNGYLFVGDDVAGNMPYFHALHPKEMYIAEDHFGRVDTVMRRFFPTVIELVSKYGIDAVSGAVKQKYDTGEYYERVECIHAVLPNDSRDAQRVDNQNMRFTSEYWEYTERHRLGEPSGFRKMPYVALRWSTNSDEVYGRGPGSDALIDVLKANQMGKTLLEAANRSVNPPLNVPEEMRNRTNLRPNGHNYYDRPDMLISPIKLGEQYPIGLDREQWVRERIEDHFLVDFFLMLQRAPKQMTATEVLERQAEKAAVLGTIIGRIASDFLDPVLNLLFTQAGRAGRVPPPPASLLAWMVQNRIRQEQLEIEYIGPLAQSQKKFHVTQGVMQGLQSALPLAQYRPEILDLFNWDETVRAIAEANGMPARLVRDQKQVDQIRRQKAEAAQQQMAMEQAQQASEVMKNVTGTGGGDPITSIGDMLAGSIGAGAGGGR